MAERRGKDKDKNSSSSEVKYVQYVMMEARLNNMRLSHPGLLKNACHAAIVSAPPCRKKS